MYLDVNSIEQQSEQYDDEISEEDERLFREMAQSPELYRRLADSISPNVFGNGLEKFALVMQLFGGVPKKFNGTIVRGDIHVLLIGDPGLAKSQMLRYVVRLRDRGIYTSGKSTSAAGLCATAVKDDNSGRWSLEAGALVLADSGHACIDELDKMSDNDRSAMHEAMESQTVSIAKAGITVQLRTRCPITGAANPINGKFNDDMPLAEQIGMPVTLLSRFDLVIVMRDNSDTKKDTSVSEHILSMRMDEKDIYPLDVLRKYTAYARTIAPKLSTEAKAILKEAYLRSRKERRGIPATPRRLESYIRLAEASARARLSSEVTREDAERAVTLMEACLRRAEPGYFERDDEIMRLCTHQETTGNELCCSD